MGKNTYISHSDEETRTLAKRCLEEHITFAKRKPLVFLLYGPLGAGKTVFVKGIGEALGVDTISSPTFVLVHEYTLTGEVEKFFHIDLYRIVDKQEFLHLGIEKDLQPNTVTCIEWSENADPIMKVIKSKAHVIIVKMFHIHENERDIQITTEYS